MFRRLLNTIKLWLVLAICAIMLLFAIVNHELVAISLFPLPYELELPKFLLGLVAFAAGLVVGGIMMSRKTGQARRLYRHEHTRCEALENEVASLKQEQHGLPS